MKMKKSFILALFAATSLSSGAFAQEAVPAAAPTPAKPIPTVNYEVKEQTSGDVTYLTGGIGDDERAAIEASKANYNVHITSSSNNGAFVSDSHVVISKDGQSVLDTDIGPLLYVQLPAGKYTLDATHRGQTKHQAFTVGKKPVKIVLGWKVPALVTEEK